MFDKKVGRMRVTVNRNGMLDHEYGHGAELSFPTGWNERCPIQIHAVSVNELRDLYYAIGRAIAAADGYERHD